MADIYEIEGPGGVFEIEADHEPTPAEVLKAVRAHGDATAAREQERLGTVGKQDGSATSRFVSNAAEMLNPIAMAKGVYNAVVHPIDTASGILAAQAGEGREAANAFQQGQYGRAIGHGIAAAVPLVGPVAAEAGEQIASGDVAGGLGKATGIMAPFGVAPAVRAARGAAPAAAVERVAGALEGGARSRVVDVMAPNVGANKVRFGAMAERVAPALLKEGDAAAWSREGIHGNVQAKLVQAEQMLDEAANNRLNARTFPTQPIIANLMEKRARLSAGAVEGSLAPRTSVTRTSSIVDQSGKPIQVTDMKRKGIGADVVPSPNTARVAEIDKAIAELKTLGPVARYEPLRRIREAYDGPAKAVYNPSVTADFLKAQGGKMGAADVTGTLREALARFDTETAKANATYSLYRTADDVLSATAEIERTRPKVGRQIMARLTGATIGGQTAGATGAVGGFLFGPALDAAVSSGVTTRLQTAQLMTRLAGAIRKGDVGHVNSLSIQLQKIAKRASAASQTGRTTSPNESPMRTAPAW